MQDLQYYKTLQLDEATSENPQSNNNEVLENGPDGSNCQLALTWNFLTAEPLINSCLLAHPYIIIYLTKVCPKTNETGGFSAVLVTQVLPI